MRQPFCLRFHCMFSLIFNSAQPWLLRKVHAPLWGAVTDRRILFGPLGTSLDLATSRAWLPWCRSSHRERQHEGCWRWRRRWRSGISWDSLRCNWTMQLRHCIFADDLFHWTLHAIQTQDLSFLGFTGVDLLKVNIQVMTWNWQRCRSHSEFWGELNALQDVVNQGSHENRFFIEV